MVPIGSMYAIYGNIHHQYTPNVSIYTIHGSYGVYHDPTIDFRRFTAFSEPRIPGFEDACLVDRDEI